MGIDLEKNKYLLCKKNNTDLRIQLIKNIKFVKINTAKLLANILIIIKKWGKIPKHLEALFCSKSSNPNIPEQPPAFTESSNKRIFYFFLI